MRGLKVSWILLVGLSASAGCDGGAKSAGGIDATVRDAQVGAATRDTGVGATVRDAQVGAATRDTGADAVVRDAQIDAAPRDTGIGPSDDDSGADADVPGDCNGPVTCPGAGANKVTVCGRLYDLETDTKIRAAVPAFASCGSGDEAEDGPCRLDLRFYDALDFASNPTTTPLAVQALHMDDCGRYVAENVELPALGFLALVVDDATAVPDDHRLTAAAFAVSSGQVRENQRSYVVRKSTDVKWSNDVGFGASTFVDRGVLMSIFYQDTAPVAGVTVTSNGAVRATDDYYFTDTEAKLRYTVTATGPTQANGAALLLNSSLVQHSGQGAEPPGCVWPSDLGASVPGVLWVLPRIAEASGGGACP